MTAAGEIMLLLFGEPVLGSSFSAGGSRRRHMQEAEMLELVAAATVTYTEAARIDCTVLQHGRLIALSEDQAWSDFGFRKHDLKLVGFVGVVYTHGQFATTGKVLGKLHVVCTDT